MRLTKTVLKKWIKALDDSIKDKWEPLERDGLDFEPDCACCEASLEMADVHYWTCDSCPIKVFTQLDDCHGTPYTAWRKLFCEVSADDDGFDDDALKELAGTEKRFLLLLREHYQTMLSRMTKKAKAKR